jgi:cell wall-associated NlpC family hydrolase
MQYSFASVGIHLPRVASDQQKAGVQIPTDKVQPGDLIFLGYPAHHVAMFIGDGKFIHSPQTGDVVRIGKYNPKDWQSAERILQ